MRTHHECIRYWERDQSVYKCIHVHIMCNIYRAIATFDYKAHVGLEEIQSSCHSPRHADIQFLSMVMINTNLTLAGTPRRACSQSTDTGTA